MSGRGAAAAIQPDLIYFRTPKPSHAIAQQWGAFTVGAVRAAIHRAGLLEPVANDGAAAVRADRRERMDRAFEAVERVTFSGDRHLEGFVVVVSAGFASSHGVLASRIDVDESLTRSLRRKFRHDAQRSRRRGLSSAM